MCYYYFLSCIERDFVYTSQIRTLFSFKYFGMNAWEWNFQNSQGLGTQLSRIHASDHWDKSPCNITVFWVNLHLDCYSTHSMLVMSNAGIYTSSVTQQVCLGPLPVWLRNKSVLNRFIQGLQVISPVWRMVTPWKVFDCW